ncbi:MAG TPA: GAF domain-containing SpoIIE family protein phosphatase, partial [Vicinamibacterales bacterium]|nr:GAF domain-containing SpoIIE family protein phosphatase [Vicinamibacterales bacterium]
LIPRADRAFVMLWDPELKRLVPNAARTRSRTAVEILASRTLLDDVLNRREAVLVLDTASDERYAKSESIYALRIRTAICTPIVFQDQIFGVIQIDSAAEGAAFNRGDLVLSVGLCAEVGMALAYARVHEQLVEQKLLEHDLDLARKIQHRFMPAMPPSVEGYSFSVEFTPALAVGGDLYDFMELGDGLTAVVIGDVSGKGVSAALFCAKLMTDLRYVSKGLTSPAAILSRVNDVLALGDHEGMFVTAAITVLNGRSGQFTIANAGHPLPFARDHAGRVEAVGRTDGPAVGLTPGARFRDHTYQLDAGDVLVFYTDGIVEALNPQKAMFGEPALLESIRGSDGSPRDIVRTIAGRVRTFAAGEPQSDDLTIISVARH